jgi:hypothetical protein
MKLAPEEVILHRLPPLVQPVYGGRFTSIWIHILYTKIR